MPVYSLEIIVVLLGIAMLMLDAFAKLDDKCSIAWLGILGLIIVFGLLFKVQWPSQEAARGAFWHFYSYGDSMALYYKGMAVLTTLIVLIMAADFGPVVVEQTARSEQGAHSQAGLGEFFALPMFACAGLMWMASANNLVSIFVSLETVTITFYILVAYLRRNVGSLEAGVKYLILGALSTGFLVYGFAWLFGITGSMELPEIKQVLSEGTIHPATALFAFALILVGLAFKVGGAPFHTWIPDVYQGAPTPITAFLSVGSKAAGFIVFLRISSLFLASHVLVGQVSIILTVIAILTLIMGNAGALPQTNFKRLMGYSSVAHAGFLLMALACSPRISQAAESLTPAAVIAFYLGAYLLMTLLAFLVMTNVRVKGGGEDLDSYRGLFRRSPFSAVAMLVSMSSLAGVPLTAGFFGKFFVFSLAVQQGRWILLIVASICASLGFYYYLKIAASMFMSASDGKGPERVPSGISVSLPARIAIVFLMVGTVLAGFDPNLIFGLFQ